MKMPKYLGLVGIAALLIAFCPLRAQADTIALGFGGPAGNLGTAPADMTVGWAFTIAETQPKLQPALLRLSAIISQYFMLCRTCSVP
jgi:hypothetical protein